MYENNGLIPDWDSLRLVLAIDRHGGVAAAARALGVTHATISRRLAKAETDAGHLFFERLPAGLRLTGAGRLVLEHAGKIEPELYALERHLISHDTDLSGSLRVTIPPLMMTGAVSRVLMQFAKENQQVTLEFVGDNNLLNLHRREADVAIRVTHKPPETLWGRKLTDQAAGFYAQSQWLSRSSLAQGDLSADVPLISFRSWKTPVPAILRRFCPNVRIAARCDDMLTAMQMVRAGLGITRMPRVLGDSLDDVSRITSLPWESYFPIWILTHPELRKAPRVEAFMKHVSAGISKLRKSYVTPVDPPDRD